MTAAEAIPPLTGSVSAPPPMRDETEDSPLAGERGKLGMWIFLAGDGTSFATAIAAYLALRVGNPAWPAPSTALGIPATAVMTFVLICSSLAMVKALAAIRRGVQSRFRIFLALTIAGGLVFLGLQAREWTHLIMERHLSIGTSLFGATFFVLTGFHACHVIAGVIYLSVLLLRALAGRLTQGQAPQVEIAGLYWHFVDLVWILIFTLVYLI